MKTYQELMTISSYLERYEYLKLGGTIGYETFGHDRYLNQMLYKSNEWKRFRRDIILRDNGLDMGHEDYIIVDRILVHHINPITVQDVINNRKCVFDPNNVISVSHITHEAIHYGNSSLLCLGPTIRTPNDTIPWR